MSQTFLPKDAKSIAFQFDVAVRALPVRNTPNVRTIRRQYSKLLKDRDPELILDVVKSLITNYGFRGPAYELLASHRRAFAGLHAVEIEALGQGINSWGAVDHFDPHRSGLLHVFVNAYGTTASATV